MNKKIIIPLAILAVLLPATGFMINDQTDSSINMNSEKIHSVMEVSKIKRSMPEILDKSQVIIEGIILSAESISKQIDEDSDRKMVFTVATVQVIEVLKGEVDSKIVKVQMFGGETAEQIVDAPRLDVNENDQVIMLLFSDPEADYLEGNYGLADWDLGIFKKDNDSAKSFSETRSIPYDDLKEAIKNGK